MSKQWRSAGQNYFLILPNSLDSVEGTVGCEFEVGPDVRAIIKQRRWCAAHGVVVDVGHLRNVADEIGVPCW